MRVIKKKIKENVYYFRFKNGTRANIVIDDELNLNRVMATFRFGSKDLYFKDYELKPGSAHFYEHVAFKVNGDNYLKLINNEKSVVNAHTTKDLTSYYFETEFTNDYTKPLKLLLEMFNNFKINEDILEGEKLIIYEEIKMSESSFVSEIIELANSSFYNKSGYKYPVLGKKKDIEQITTEDIKYINQNIYTTRNIKFDISGNIDIDLLFEILEEFDNNYNNKKTRWMRIKDSKSIKENYIEALSTYGEPYLLIKYKIKPLKFNSVKAKYINEILSELLFEKNSNFISMIKENNLGKIYQEAYLSNEYQFDSLAIYLDTNEVKLAVDLINDYISNELINDVNEEIIENIKRKIIGKYLMLEDSKYVSNKRALLLYKLRINREKYLKRINDITKKDIVKYLKRININNKVVVYLK